MVISQYNENGNLTNWQRELNLDRVRGIFRILNQRATNLNLSGTVIGCSNLSGVAKKEKFNFS
jgi:hypothetical protein